MRNRRGRIDNDKGCAGSGNKNQRAYVEAPRAACVASIREKMHVSEERAHQLIRRTDRYRAKYYSYYTGGKDWTNPTNYDMVLNSDRIGREGCVELLVWYVRHKFLPITG